MNIIENIPLNSKWMSERDSATDTVVYLYSTICDRFKKDKRYVEEFVKDNQELIGLLVNSATVELSGKCREKLNDVGNL